MVESSILPATTAKADMPKIARVPKSQRLTFDDKQAPGVNKVSGAQNEVSQLNAAKYMTNKYDEIW